MNIKIVGTVPTIFIFIGCMFVGTVYVSSPKPFTACTLFSNNSVGTVDVSSETHNLRPMNMRDKKCICFCITTHVSSSSHDTYDVIRRGTKRVSQHIARETACQKRPAIGAKETYYLRTQVLHHNKLQRLYQKQFQLKKGH